MESGKLAVLIHGDRMAYVHLTDHKTSSEMVHHVNIHATLMK